MFDFNIRTFMHCIRFDQYVYWISKNCINSKIYIAYYFRPDYFTKDELIEIDDDLVDLKLIDELRNNCKNICFIYKFYKCLDQFEYYSFLNNYVNKYSNLKRIMRQSQPKRQGRLNDNFLNDPYIQIIYKLYRHYNLYYEIYDDMMKLYYPMLKLKNMILNVDRSELKNLKVKPNDSYDEIINEIINICKEYPLNCLIGEFILYNIESIEYNEIFISFKEYKFKINDYDGNYIND